MTELVVISGKGGTGKTSLTASLAVLAKDVVLADCDVDAADLHLLLQPENRQRYDYHGGHRAEIDPQRCTACGRCLSVCRFGAIDVVTRTDQPPLHRIDPMACEGCKVCVALCPEGAIDWRPCVNGHWFVSQTRLGPMVHARLRPGEENSGKLVTLIRRQARQLAEQQDKDWLIVDGSPGVGCPVIASLTGADLALIVTEPTVSGLHDLGRIAELCGRLEVPALVCINKADLHPPTTARIEAEVQRMGATCVGTLPYDPVFTQAQMVGRALVEVDREQWRRRIESLWERIRAAATPSMGVLEGASARDTQPHQKETDG